MKRNNIRNTQETNTRLVNRPEKDSSNSRLLGSLWALILEASQAISKGNATLGWNEKTRVYIIKYFTMLELLEK